LQASPFFTKELQSADAIYVDDYCYTITNIAQEHSRLGGQYSDGFEPWRQLQAGYSRLAHSSRRV
jgi:hypothetical protein